MQRLGTEEGRAAPVGDRLVSRLRELALRALFYGVMAALAVIMAGWSASAILLQQVLPRRLRAPVGQRLEMAASRLFLTIMRVTGCARFDLRDLDALRHEGALIIAPNHPSLLDALLVTSRLPRCFLVAKAELWDHPLLGAGMRLADYVRNDTPLDLVKRTVAKLKGGREQLLLFPEGTRTEVWPLSPLRGGFAAIAKRAGVPIQTVLIETSSPFLGKGWPFFRRPAFPLVYRARLGRRFEVTGDTKAAIAEIERYLAAAVEASGRPPRAGGA